MKWLAGIIVVLALAAGVIWFVRRRRAAARSATSTSTSTSSAASSPATAAAPGAVTPGRSRRIVGWRPSLAQATHAVVVEENGTTSTVPILPGSTEERLWRLTAKPLSPLMGSA